MTSFLLSSVLYLLYTILFDRSSHNAKHCETAFQFLTTFDPKLASAWLPTLYPWL